MAQLDSIRITDIICMQTIVQPAVHETTVHARSHYGLSFCQDGRILYSMDNRQFISDHSHAILHPMGSTYKLQVDRPGHFPLINFDCTGLEDVGFLAIPLQNPDSYLRRFEQMQQQALFRQDRLKLLGMFYDMLSDLSREQAGDPLPLAGMLTYMEEHLNDPNLSNAHLSAQAGFSEVYFRRLFAQTYGMPPRQYLLNMRLKKARQLLTDSDLTVTEIAERCGFSSVYHFSRSFTQRIGMSPTAYTHRNKPRKI